MQGMFRANGGCGYVKKPDILLEVGPDNEVFDPKRVLPMKKILKVGARSPRRFSPAYHKSWFLLIR